MATSLYNKIKGAMTTGKLRSVNVPEWGVDVWYKTTSIPETQYAIDILKEAGIDAPSEVEYRAALVCTKALSPEGVRVFDNAQVREMIEWPCADLYTRLSSLMSKGVSLEDAKKGSGTTQS